MQVAEYPERRCREAVFNDAGMAYSCEVVDLHPGPCASFSVLASVERREQYEKANPDWRQHLRGVTDQ